MNRRYRGKQEIKIKDSEIKERLKRRNTDLPREIKIGKKRSTDLDPDQNLPRRAKGMRVRKEKMIRIAKIEVEIKREEENTLLLHPHPRRHHLQDLLHLPQALFLFPAQSPYL